MNWYIIIGLILAFILICGFSTYFTSIANYYKSITKRNDIRAWVSFRTEITNTCNYNIQYVLSKYMFENKPYPVAKSDDDIKAIVKKVYDSINLTSWDKFGDIFTKDYLMDFIIEYTCAQFTAQIIIHNRECVSSMSNG